jgi:hypothetical protein
MAYSRFTGLVPLRTRGVVLLAAVAFAGFASAHPRCQGAEGDAGSGFWPADLLLGLTSKMRSHG